MSRLWLTLIGIGLAAQACGGSGSATGAADGGTTGGTSSGGAPSGGAPSGGSVAGGTGGAGTGGTGAAATGGSAGSGGSAGAAPDGGSCPSGKLDCNGIQADGCETDPLTSVWNCGTCGNQCPEPTNTTRACNAGKCEATCNADTADCDGSLATNGCEVFLKGDKNNCGQCGKVCPAENGLAECLSAKCGVQLLALPSSVSDIDDLHVTATHVYFRAGSSPGRVAKSGGAFEPIAISPGQGGVGHVAFSASHVFWVPNSTPGQVMSAPLAGGSTTLLSTITGSVSLPGAATDGTSLYWCEKGSGGGLKSVPVGGGSTVTVAADANCSVRPVLDATYAYWAGQVPTGFFVKRAPKAGGAVETFGPFGAGMGFIAALAVGGPHAYVIVYDATAGAILRFPLNGDAPSVLVSTVGGHGLVTDGTKLFVRGTNATGGGKGIFSIPVTGTPVTGLATCPVSANWGERDLAVDGTHVYWGNAGKLHKLLK